MRYLSYKIIAACILLPPVLYILTAYLAERHFKTYWAERIESVYLGDTGALLSGEARLEDAVSDNIERFLRSQPLTRMGLKVTVTVTSRGGKLLYPPVFRGQAASRTPAGPDMVARDNFSLLSEGLQVAVDVKFEHNRLLSNSCLGLYVLLSLAVFYGHFRRAASRTELQEAQRRREIERLKDLEQRNTRKLEALLAERERLKTEFALAKENLYRVQHSASRNEDELIEEIEALEEKLDANLSLQQAQQDEIAALKERLALWEREPPKGKKKKGRGDEWVRKRFATLYKNIRVHERAVAGFVSLGDELRLKAEEVIHQLNADAALVPVKRKVFGGKGQVTVLEVAFGYKGRLYFRYADDRRVEVVAIGTKNTQARELEFLGSL